jgi:hypothetical protein
MAINLVRVINQQTIPNRSILLDKIDRSQGNFSGYANVPKQKLYVPYRNPVDPSVKGYVDLVPSDQVLLHLRADGVIAKHASTGRVTSGLVSSASLTTPVVSAALYDISDAVLTITGTTFTSVSPDVTYVTLTNLAGVSQKIPSSAFGSGNAITITIAAATITIGTVAANWKVVVLANSRVSNTFLSTTQA